MKKVAYIFVYDACQRNLNVLNISPEVIYLRNCFTLSIFKSTASSAFKLRMYFIPLKLDKSAKF